jgi:peptide chain release factor subunit 1
METNDQDAKTNDEAVEQWKLKKLIRMLESVSGNGTSVISLIAPPKDQISRLSKMLLDESARATNIQCRTNRQSVLDTISSLQQRLKLFTKVPQNGLIAFCGTVMNVDGNENKLLVTFEPFKPINTSMYMCDSKFHTEALSNLFEQDDKVGFIVIDGHGCLFGLLTGSNRTTLSKFHVDLPNKHGRGGQSEIRFARLRLEKRHNYIHKVAELATSHFITNDIPNIKALILAGCADFKLKLNSSPLFDLRLAAIVIKIVDVAYGQENGFNQAIGLSADAIANVSFRQEQQLLSRFFMEIAKNTGKSCFGIKETLFALHAGAVKELIVNESLDLKRYVLKHLDTQIENIVCLSPLQESCYFTDENIKWEVVDKTSVIDWFIDNFKKFGASLQFVTDKSQQGYQFCKGFGGVGGLLRYNLNVPEDDLSDAGLDFYEE